MKELRTSYEHEYGSWYSHSLGRTLAAKRNSSSTQAITRGGKKYTGRVLKSLLVLEKDRERALESLLTLEKILGRVLKSLLVLEKNNRASTQVIARFGKNNRASNQSIARFGKKKY